MTFYDRSVFLILIWTRQHFSIIILIFWAKGGEERNGFLLLWVRSLHILAGKQARGEGTKYDGVLFF